MNFQKKFNEAVQAAVIRKLDTDNWEQLPWLAAQVELATLNGLTPEREESTSDVQGKVVDRALRKQFSQELLWPTPEKAVNLLVEHAAAAAPTDAEHQPDESDSYFVSNDFAHVDGFNYQIVVIDRLKSREHSYAVHFNRMPTSEEWQKEHAHFHKRTHWVHVNEWTGTKWESITQHYDPSFNPNHGKSESAAETFTATDEWPEGKTFRIKFWDQRTNANNYVYFDYRPGGMTLAKYHGAKVFAVVEARPVQA